MMHEVDTLVISCRIFLTRFVIQTIGRNCIQAVIPASDFDLADKAVCYFTGGGLEIVGSFKVMAKSFMTFLVTVIMCI